MLKTLIRPAMIFVPLSLGVIFPQANGLNFLIRYLLMVMLFMVFLRLDFKELKLRRSHFMLLAVNLLLGIGCYWIVLWLFKDKTLAQSAFFVAVTPTATAAAVVMSFLRGNVGYVITSFVTTNVGIALVMPWLLGWVCGNSSLEFMLKVAETLVYLLLLPFSAAVILRKFYPEARNLPQKLATATFGLWSLCLFIIAASAMHFLLNNPQLSRWIIVESCLIAMVICALNFTLGYYLGEKGLRREASQSLGQKNTTLTIYLAFAYAGPLAAMGVISYVLWHNSFNAWQMFIFDRQQARVKHHNSE